MMYKIQNTIKEVKGIKIDSNIEIIGYLNRDLFVNSRKIASNVDTTTGSLNTFNSFLFFNIEDSTLIYDLKNELLFDFKGFKCYPYSLESNKIICVYDTKFSDNRFSWRTGLLSVKEQIIINEYYYLKDKSVAYYLNKNFVIVYINSNSLIGLSLLTGEYAWEVSIKEEDKIVSILGVEREVLVVCVQHPDLRFGLLGIEVQTGAIRWQKHDWQWLKGYHTVLQNVKIFSLKGDFTGNTHFIEAEASTATILRSGELPALKQAGISIFNYTLQDNYIYFTAHPIGKSEANMIGVLAYDSLELLWWQEVALENNAFFGASNKPEVAANKLYVLDTGGTLHIFEKELI